MLGTGILRTARVTSPHTEVIAEETLLATFDDRTTANLFG